MEEWFWGPLGALQRQKDLQPGGPWTLPSPKQPVTFFLSLAPLFGPIFSLAGQGRRDSPWLSSSRVQTLGLVWIWAPSAPLSALDASASSSRGLQGLQVAPLGAHVTSETQDSDHRHTGGVSVCECVHVCVSMVGRVVHTCAHVFVCVLVRMHKTACEFVQVSRACVSMCVSLFTCVHVGERVCIAHVRAFCKL